MKNRLNYLILTLILFLASVVGVYAQDEAILDAPDCRKENTTVISSTTVTWILGVPVPMTCTRTKTECLDDGDISYGEWSCAIGFGAVEDDLRDYDNLAFNDTRFDKDFQGRTIAATAEAAFIPAPGTCNACQGGKQVCATKDGRIYKKDCGPDQITES